MEDLLDKILYLKPIDPSERESAIWLTVLMLDVLERYGLPISEYFIVLESRCLSA